MTNNFRFSVTSESQSRDSVESRDMYLLPMAVPVGGFVITTAITVCMSEKAEGWASSAFLFAGAVLEAGLWVRNGHFEGGIVLNF